MKVIGYSASFGSIFSNTIWSSPSPSFFQFFTFTWYIYFRFIDSIAITSHYSIYYLRCYIQKHIRKSISRLFSSLLRFTIVFKQILYLVGSQEHFRLLILDTFHCILHFLLVLDALSDHSGHKWRIYLLSTQTSPIHITKPFMMLYLIDSVKS